MIKRFLNFLCGVTPCEVNRSTPTSGADLRPGDIIWWRYCGEVSRWEVRFIKLGSIELRSYPGRVHTVQPSVDQLEFEVERLAK